MFLFITDIFKHVIKITLLQTLVCKAWLQRFANVLYCAVGLLYLCVQEEKNKIDFFERCFPSTEAKRSSWPKGINCTALQAGHQSSQSFFCNYFTLFISCQCIKLQFYTCIQLVYIYTFCSLCFSEIFYQLVDSYY